jgi:hypothetical protein
MNLKYWIIKSILLVILLVGLFSKIFINYCYKLKCIDVNLDGYEESVVYEHSRDTYKALYQNVAEGFVRIEKRKVGKDDQALLIDSAILKINALFENASSPYPGQISDEIECPEVFHPIETTIDKEEVVLKVVEVYLTDRLAIGACSDAQAKYKEIVTWMYCEDHDRLYQIEYIIEKEKFEQKKNYYYSLFNHLSCN